MAHYGAKVVSNAVTVLRPAAKEEACFRLVSFFAEGRGRRSFGVAHVDVVTRCGNDDVTVACTIDLNKVTGLKSVLDRTLQPRDGGQSLGRLSDWVGKQRTVNRHASTYGLYQKHHPAERLSAEDVERALVVCRFLVRQSWLTDEERGAALVAAVQTPGAWQKLAIASVRRHLPGMVTPYWQCVNCAGPVHS